MTSRTKFPITASALPPLFGDAGIESVTRVTPLGSGEYNAVFSAEANGKAYAIKIAPKEGTPVLTYERNLMASELFWYNQLREHTGITVPAVYYSDPSLKRIPAAFFIMEKLPGRPLNEIKAAPAENAAARMAEMTARMHGIKNDRFGYIQNGLHDNWYLAVKAMTEALLHDAAGFGRPSKKGAVLSACISRYQDILAKADCRMVNFDMWPSNIIVTGETEGPPRYAWIDPERSFWGDRTADFVCLEITAPLEQKTVSLAAYNAAADAPLEINRETRIRFAVAQAYLGLVMETEKYARYTLRHFGWWRNALVSRMLFKKAFAVLT